MSDAALSLFYSLTVLEPQLPAAAALCFSSPTIEEAAAIALRMKMPHIFFANLKKFQLTGLLKSETLAIFKKEEQAAVQRGFYWMSRLRWLATLLKEGGVDFMPLKGSSMITGVYQDPGLRFSLDLDIFIDIGQFTKCRAVLEKNGFRLVPGQLTNGVFIDKGRECTFIGPDGDEVDVHYRFFQWHVERYVFKIRSADLFSARLRQIPWRGMPLDRLRPEDEFYYFLLCVVSDHFSEFRYYADADALVRVHGPHFDLGRLEKHIERSPLRRILRDMMRFMKGMLGTPLPGTLSGKGEADSQAPALKGLFERRFFYFMTAERPYDKINLVRIFILWEIFIASGLFRRYFILRNNPQGKIPDAYEMEIERTQVHQPRA